MKFLRRVAACGALSWELLRIFLQLIYGAWRLSRLPDPMVSIFGGSRLAQTNIFFTKAHELGQRLISHGISVATGGGPGVMQAVSCGAAHVQHKYARSIGIGVTSFSEERNPCVEDYFELDQFFARKWLLTHYSEAFVIFPGGFGTLDELNEILTLIQTKHIKRVPIILFGSQFWKPFMNWITSAMLKDGLVSKDDIELFIITDDIDQVFFLICDRCVQEGHVIGTDNKK